MKKLNLILSILTIASSVIAQTPQFFQYQCVVRDGAGIAVVNQSVNFQISIISGSPGGTVEYTETHSTSTNPYGIATLEIGNGTPVTGSFASVSWGTATHYIKVEADPAGGTTYIDMGTTQLLSVPYALYSEQAGNVQTYSAGTAINISGNVINNTAPDQTVTLTPGGATAISGTYPNFTISSTDNNTTYSAGTGMTLSGTTFNAQTTTALWNANQLQGRSISSSAPSNGQVLGWNGTNWAPASDLNSGTPGGVNKTIQFNNSSNFGGDTALIWDNSNKRLGVGLTNPAGRVVIQGSASAPATEPLFEVKNRTGQQVMVVYEDSVHFYISDDILMTNKGGFAVSGRNNSKQLTNNFLKVTPDSTRIWTGDTIAGFAVENIEVGQSSSYMHLNPSNYFIGHNSGHLVTTGLHNCTFGYKADSALTTGNSNIAIGYEAGKLNYGDKNVFIGYRSGFSNLMGGDNVFIGYESGYSYTGQYGAVCIGTGAGKYTSGPNNTIIGRYAGMNSTGGSNNVMIGASCGGNFTGGNSVLVGTGTGAGSGGWNTFLGCNVGDNNTTGTYNLFAGWRSADANTTGNNNVFLGYYSGRMNQTGNNSVYIGSNAGYTATAGAGNVFIGYQAGYTETGSNELYIENSNDVTNPLVHGDFTNDRIAFHRTAATYPLRVGTTTTNGNGAYLTTGGVWTNGSSRNFKDRFTDIDTKNLLSKIENMEIKGWFYKETQEYHIGPFAEDFYNAFGTGVLNSEEDLGKYLSASDVAGVSLLAVQNLIKENKLLKERIQQLEKSNAAMIEKMSNLESIFIK